MVFPANFDMAQKFVAKWEGGYIFHPNDPGGATNYGVSLRWLRELGLEDGDVDGDGDIDVDDIKSLTPEKAAALFKKHFWHPYHCEELPELTACIYYDTMVNTGPKQAAKIMQRGYNACKPSTSLSVDGIAGPLTRASMQAMKDSSVFLVSCIDARDNFYRGLVTSKPKFKSFLKGWLNRTTDLRRYTGVYGI